MANDRHSENQSIRPNRISRSTQQPTQHRLILKNAQTSPAARKLHIQQEQTQHSEQN